MREEWTKDNASPLAWEITHGKCCPDDENFGPCGKDDSQHCCYAIDMDGELGGIRYFVEQAGPLLSKMPPVKLDGIDIPVKWTEWVADLLIELTPATEHKGGWVYFIQCNQYTKIGLSGNVNARLKALQTASPYPLTLIAQFAAAKPEYIESFLHSYFADKRRIGEWFDLSPADLGQVRSWNAAQLHRMSTTAASRGIEFLLQWRDRGKDGLPQDALDAEVVV